MNSELEKLIEKYRITVNGLVDLEGDYEKVIKERGFVTLNGLLVESDASHNTDGAPAANTEENTSVSPAPSESSEEHSPSGEPATESDASHNTDGAPVVPAGNTPVVPAPSDPATEQPGVTPVVEGPVSGDTNLGNEVAGGERAAGTEDDTASTDEHNPSGEEETSEDDTASTEDSTTGRKPKKKKN